MSILSDARAKAEQQKPARRRPPRRPEDPPPATGEPPPPALSGWEVIRDYFRQKYGDGFKVGDGVFSNRDRREVRRLEACGALPPDLIEPLGRAEDAPHLDGRNGTPGPVNVDALPRFFGKWAPTAWVAFVAELPDEDGARDGQVELAADEFRRLVREAMCTEVTLGTSHRGHGLMEQQERRSLVEWCERFAKPGPWRAIRSKRCWCKRRPTTVEGEVGELMIAIRHEVFAQLKADRRLVELGPNRFSRRAERYGVGKPDRDDRPHGQRAVVLDTEFVADLLADLPDPPDPPPDPAPELLDRARREREGLDAMRG